MTDDDIARGRQRSHYGPTRYRLEQSRHRRSPRQGIITLRLDRDLLKWLRAQGKGYQTLINQVLRAWYDAQPKPAAKKHKIELSAEDRREAASWKRVYAAAAKAKKAAAKPAAPTKKRA